VIVLSQEGLKLDSVKIVNEKNLILTEKAKMLIDRYPGNFYDIRQAVKAVLVIEDKNNYSLEEFQKLLSSEIINEVVQQKIFNVRGYGNAYQQSIKGKEKTETEDVNVELKVTKKSKWKKDLIVLLVYVISVSGVLYGGSKIVKNIKEAYEKHLDDKADEKDDDKILPDVKYEGNTKYEEKTSLVHDNTEIVGYYNDEAGNKAPIINHNYSQIAKDILKLEDENINSFEFNLYDVFKELDTGDSILALKKMDQIIKELKMLTYDNSNYIKIYNKLETKSCFLEMLFSVTDKYYDENMEYINEYLNNGTSITEKCRGNIEFILSNYLDSFAKVDGGRK